MKTFVSGVCDADNIFNLIDPTTFTEAEFEGHTRAVFECVYRDYHCIPFRGAFEFDGVIHEADLALVHRTYSHWFVVEVELISHSLHGHVVPQVRCFRYGRPLPSCAEYLHTHIPGMTLAQAQSLVRFVPRSVAVVANRNDTEWAGVLRGVDTQFVTVSVFRREDGRFAHETEGSLHVAHLSLGFFQYSAPNRTIRMSLSTGIAEGRLQMEDPYGNVGLWDVRVVEDNVWVTKATGDPGLPDKCMLQVLRTHAGKITLRLH